MRYVDPVVENIAADGPEEGPADGLTDQPADRMTEGLIDWLNRELPTTEVATIRTGFMTARALHAVRDAFERLLERGGLLRMVVGGELQQCDIDALRILLELENRFSKLVTVLIVVDVQSRQSARTYHLHHAGGRESAWVGSANLNFSTTESNQEASVILDSTDDSQAEIKKIFMGTLAVIADGKGALLDERLLASLNRRLRAADPLRRPVHLGPVTTFGDNAQKLIERLERGSDLGRDEQALPTGFTSVDSLLHGGLRPGTLTVVGSRPSVGRSTFALNIATHAALEHAVPTCLFSFESAVDEIRLRIISAVAGVNLVALHTTRLEEDHWLHVAEAAGRLEGAPLLLNSSPAPRLDHLLGIVDDAAVQHDLGLVVLDPINSIGLPPTGHDQLDGQLDETRKVDGADEVGEVARAFKTLALRRQLRIVVAAQIAIPDVNARGGASGRALPPAPTELRSSAALLDIADTVLMVHRPTEDVEYMAVETDVIVAKNRFGDHGHAPLLFHGPQAQFLDLAEYRPPSA